MRGLWFALGWVALAWLGGSILLGCSVGEGEGDVTSERLIMGTCWEGPFDLQPSFFAAQPFDDTLRIRVQRGEQDIERADGVSLLVNGVSNIRRGRLNQPLSVGLPPGVSPPGYPIREVPRPVDVSLTLYLNNSCDAANSALYAVGGTVSFARLFSGDPNENNAEDRRTDGKFDVIVVDPRDAIALDTPDPDSGLPYYYPEDRTSELAGEFKFVFHRGTPAQPFP
jgi:hypothetical protein